jgi:hypothetical protein
VAIAALQCSCVIPLDSRPRWSPAMALQSRQCPGSRRPWLSASKVSLRRRRWTTSVFWRLADLAAGLPLRRERRLAKATGDKGYSFLRVEPRLARRGIEAGILQRSVEVQHDDDLRLDRRAYRR